MNYGDIPAHNKAYTRDNLQNLFDRAFISGNNSALRENYRVLRNIELDKLPDTKNERINISVLAENLTIACDILTADAGVNFLFCGNDTSVVFANGKSLTKAILNLLSNAYLHGKGRLVTVKSVETSDFIEIHIKNEGRFYSSQYGRGLNFVHKACSDFGGFFIKTDCYSTDSVIFIKKAPAKNCKDFYVPNFSEYLGDRLSPVYVEMFGMEYH